MFHRTMVPSWTKLGLDRIRHAVLLVALAVSCGSASADDKIPTLDGTRAKTIVEQIDADHAIADFFRMCPADAYRRRGDLTGDASVLLETCGRDPADCLAQCLNAASGHHCFTLARILQGAEGVNPLYGEKLYQMACVSGDAGGCVNRGSGIRNGRFKGDPYAERPAAEREACEFRSFMIGCDNGHGWGCAMLGQAYADGEGTASDAVKAKEAYEKACRIDAHFVACDFAKGKLAIMKDGAPAAKPDGK